MDYNINEEVLTFYQVVMILVGIVGLIGNVLVCVTICYTRTLHNVTNFMILNLAIADVLVSTLYPVDSSITLHNMYVRKLILNNTQCTSELIFLHNSTWTYYFFINCFSAQSVLSLTLANFERFIGITRPLQYPNYFTRRKIILLLLAVWVIPPMVHLPRTVFMIIQYQSDNCSFKYSAGETIFGIVSMIVFLVPIGATIWMYIRILGNLRQGARNLEEQGIQGPAQQLHQAQTKVTSTLAIVTIAFFILVLPGAIWFFMDPLLRGSDIISVSDNFIIWDIMSSLSLVNSAINPVLYGFKYEQLRKAFKSMVCRCDRWRQPNQVGPEIQTVETQ